MAFHRNTLLFVALLPASIQLACAGMAVPAGFEDLAKTQRLWTEVNLYGESLGLFETDITLETVSFVAPETVVAAIKRRFNDAPPSLPPSLPRWPFRLPVTATWPAAATAPQRAAIIDTDRAAIIYDENNARINLFLDKKFLPKQTAENHGISPRTAPKMR
jgi:hypothetical protein